jgi:hypothetical protein
MRKSLGTEAVILTFSCGNCGHGTNIALGQFGTENPKEIGMATQIVMDHSGDTRHFDAADTEALSKADKRFKALTSVGFTAAVRNADGEVTVTRSFDPTAEETLFFPRLVGG